MNCSPVNSIIVWKFNNLYSGDFYRCLLENCYLNVKKLPKSWHKTAKNGQVFGNYFFYIQIAIVRRVSSTGLMVVKKWTEKILLSYMQGKVIEDWWICSIFHPAVWASNIWVRPITLHLWCIPWTRIMLMFLSKYMFVVEVMGISSSIWTNSRTGAQFDRVIAEICS